MRSLLSPASRNELLDIWMRPVDHHRAGDPRCRGSRFSWPTASRRARRVPDGIQQIFDVDLPRPRDRGSFAFHKLREELLAQLMGSTPPPEPFAATRRRRTLLPDHETLGTDRMTTEDPARPPA